MGLLQQNCIDFARDAPAEPFLSNHIQETLQQTQRNKCDFLQTQQLFSGS